MSYLPVDQLKPGMSLAADVTDVNGRLLLAKDGKIQSKHIKMFKMWGIGEVDVVGSRTAEEPHGAPTDPLKIERVARITQRVFHLNDLTHPLIKEIFTRSILYRSKNGLSDAQDTGGQLSTASNRPYEPADVRANMSKKNIKLPEIPSIVFELNEVMANPLACADDIALVVSKSPSLSALLLKMVNSAYYGFPTKIDSVTRAVTLIGSREISALGLGISTMRIFKDIPKDLIDVQAFFKHSLACGIVSRILAGHLNIQHTEQYFVSGLLHDIGRVIVFKYFPGQAEAMLAEARSSNNLLYNVESDHLGCRHTHIGRDLFQKWKLPYALENSTYYHHTPSRAADPSRAAVVHLADICVHGLGLGNSGERLVPPLDDAACDVLKVHPKMIHTVLNQAVHQLGFLESVFEEADNTP